MLIIKVRGRKVTLVDEDDGSEIVQVLGDDDQLTVRMTRLRPADYVFLELGDWFYAIHGADDSRVLNRRRPSPARSRSGVEFPEPETGGRFAC